MIYWRLYLKENKDDANLIISLSNILRYALEPIHSETTVKEELEQINNYIRIQKARFDDGLQIDVDVEEGVENCQIIRLLLQPLVENVFVHAFRDQLDIAVLEIKVFRQNDFLLIAIHDNGCGMDLIFFSE